MTASEEARKKAARKQSPLTSDPRGGPNPRSRKARFPGPIPPLLPSSVPVGSSPSGSHPFRRPGQSLSLPHHLPGRPRAQQLTVVGHRSLCHACQGQANIRLRGRMGTTPSLSLHSPATSATPPTYFRPTARSKHGLRRSPAHFLTSPLTFPPGGETV